MNLVILVLIPFFNHYFYAYKCNKGVFYIGVLLNPPHPGAELFEELALNFDINKDTSYSE